MGLASDVLIIVKDAKMLKVLVVQHIERVLSLSFIVFLV